jgi:4-hydroxy-2-oxoheptanedioate aldolase
MVLVCSFYQDKTEAKKGDQMERKGLISRWTDMLFIGPNDLAASMAYVPFDHASIEEVQMATSKVLKATKEKGKFAGHFALSAEIGKTRPLKPRTPCPTLKKNRNSGLKANKRPIAAQRSKQGWEFMNCGADIVAVTAWMSAEMVKMKALLEQENLR